MDKNIEDVLTAQKKLEKTGKKLIIFWFLIGLILGALIF